MAPVQTPSSGHVARSAHRTARRTFLGRIAALGLGAGAFGLLQACASAPAPTPTTPPVRPTATAQPQASAGQPAATATARALFRTVNSGVLTVAMSGDLPMTGVKDDRIVGVDGEIVGLIAERLELKATPLLLEWSATIEAVRAGRADLVLGGMTWTKARAEVMCLTDALYSTGRFLAQKKGAGVETVEALKGKTVGTVTGHPVVPEMKKVPGIKDVKLYSTTDACIADVVAGTLDAALLDGLLVDYLIRQNPDWGLENLLLQTDRQFPLLTGRNHAVMGMAEGNLELFHAVNRGIKWGWEQGANKAILLKYGTTHPAYLKPPDPDPRVGVDRDAQGNLTDRCK